MTKANLGASPLDWNARWACADEVEAQRDARPSYGLIFTEGLKTENV
jgi:hypothetical protein